MCHQIIQRAKEDFKNGNKFEILGTGGNIYKPEERAFFSRISLVLRFDKVNRQTLVKHDKKEG